MSRYADTFALPCRAASLRGQLKHTSLTNKVCLKTLPEDLLESMLKKEHGVPQHQFIRNQLNELSQMMADAEHGFSPAQLVDQLSPFQELSVEKRDEIKRRVHRQFAREFQLTERKQQFDTIAAEFISELDTFVAHSATKARMESVQEAARALIYELESLPKGIWLWKTAGSKTIPS